MDIEVQKICELFNLEVKSGSASIIKNISSIQKQSDSTLMWARSAEYIEKVSKGVLICSDDHYLKAKVNEEVTYLITSESPRLIFAKIVRHFIGNTAINLKNEVSIHQQRNDIQISENCFIGPNVEIGKGTKIYPNVVIHSGTRIGENCIIKSFCSLGSEGLGFEVENGELIKFPQLGGVQIGNNVEFGPNSTIRRAALDDTIIENGCKIGAFVNIGHNCIIKKNAILSCQIVTAGGSIVGENVFMGVGSSVKQKVEIGNNSVVGQGAIILKNIEENKIVVGNPGRVIGNTNEK